MMWLWYLAVGIVMWGLLEHLLNALDNGSYIDVAYSAVELIAMLYLLIYR